MWYQFFFRSKQYMVPRKCFIWSWTSDKMTKSVLTLIITVSTYPFSLIHLFICFLPELVCLAECLQCPSRKESCTQSTLFPLSTKACNGPARLHSTSLSLSFCLTVLCCIMRLCSVTEVKSYNLENCSVEFSNKDHLILKLPKVIDM